MAHFMIISCLVLSLVPFTLLIFTLFWQLIFLPNCQIASKSSSTPDHFRPLACAPKAAWMWNLHPPKFPSSLSFLRKSIGELLVSSMSHACFRMGGGCQFSFLRDWLHWSSWRSASPNLLALPNALLHGCAQRDVCHTPSKVSCPHI